MAKMSRTTTIEAPVAEVFEFAKDVGKLWVCFPDCAVRDVDLTPDGVGTSAEWFEKLLGLHLKGRVEYTEVVPGERIVARSSMGPVWTFTFAPQDGATSLTLDCEWTLDVPVVGVPVEELMFKLSGGDIERMLATVKARVEGARTPAAPPSARAAQSITIDAPVEKVFGFARDIGKLWSAHPNMAVREVHSTPDGVGSSAQWFGGLLGLHFEDHVEFVEVVPDERIVVRSTPRAGIEFLWTLTFAPADGGTEVTLAGTSHVAVLVADVPLGDHLPKWTESSMQQMPAHLKTRIERVG
ncbi:MULTISPECIES: SRPBCC family protein [Rhodococcus]|uniref:SRPBCC family protein n=1 Tax=Rhodococcus TaxID=1827 RepID=UPI000C7B5A72|nr:MULTISPECIES: SRPBCC family protein [Rhodococcus]AUM15671.1 bacterio-opsin linked protein [Rhodococcus ruber]MBD8056181.1 SRPBCC family protein [Rhodococcus ruber]MCF8783378.1 SRPBCC family protein [Rhodococcus ruber]MCZ1074342.1 SRPBCC family protein [Rhodococcus sp. A5(2022)]